VIRHSRRQRSLLQIGKAEGLTGHRALGPMFATKFGIVGPRNAERIQLEPRLQHSSACALCISVKSRNCYGGYSISRRGVPAASCGWAQGLPAMARLRSSGPPHAVGEFASQVLWGTSSRVASSSSTAACWSKSRTDVRSLSFAASARASYASSKVRSLRLSRTWKACTGSPRDTLTKNVANARVPSQTWMAFWPSA
jgi:hypothetical protein